MSLSWDPSLTIGYGRLDEQHQELFRRVDVLLGNLRRGQLDEELAKLFAFLEDYVVEHFAEEEALMESTGYPLARPHQIQHRAFREGLVKQRAVLAAEGASPEFLDRIASFLVGWLQAHIGTADRALGRFLQERRAAGPGAAARRGSPGAAHRRRE